jgi:hypothetical protein
MRFEDKLKQNTPQAIWEEYCGFLKLDVASFMRIQNRLMEEQIQVFLNSPLGKQLSGGMKNCSIRQFREEFPLTSYQDYAETLLLKRDDMLPEAAVLWLQTTWEGGRFPIKIAPYSQGMLTTFRNNLLACLILATGKGEGSFDISSKYHFLYGLAPLPYATGLFPRALNKEIDISFLPPVKEAESMSFSERNKKGFKMGLSSGIDYFFGLGSVLYFVSTSFSKLSAGGSGGSLLKTIKSMSLLMIWRYITAKRSCKKEGREMKPRDLFHLRGFMVAGTDNHCYKDELEDLWGIRPMELFAGTEPTLVGTETWTRDGMIFFPDACFYEFIPEEEMERSLEDPGYIPKTCLMEQVVAGEKYELVVSVLKGGAFMRYRVGDVYRCLALTGQEDGVQLPRFQYIDRSPDVIDIAGFTRITKASIESVMELSGLPIVEWVAAKEYTSGNKPFMHLYVELDSDALAYRASTREVLRDHLSIYFKYLDQDYQDLKKILGMDPLEITILKCGTFKAYQEQNHASLRRMNPKLMHLRQLTEMQEKVWGCQGGDVVYE